MNLKTSGTLHRVKISGVLFCQLSVAFFASTSFVTPARAADQKSADSNEIRIVQIQGTVEIMPAGAKNWVTTQVTNQIVHPGDRLRSGEKSRVTLGWSDQSVVPFGPQSEIEILPPDKSDSLAGLSIVRGIFSFFHRDNPGRIRVLTRGANASIEGTEFVMEVSETNGDERVAIAVMDGKVQFSNAHGSLVLTNSQQAVAEPGQPPVRTPGFNANNLLQWCFYYPAVLDLKDLPLSADETEALKESLQAYRSGDLSDALAKYPASRQPGSDTDRVYHAALLLSVGQVEQSEVELNSLHSTKEINSISGSLRTLVAAVKHDSQRVILNPQTSTELLAASYHEQSRATGDASLKQALEFTRRATTLSPEFGFAWERLAELEFGFGRTREAEAALDKSLSLSPHNAQAMALKGFLLAAQSKTSDAATWFDRAIAADGALGNAWLGRGLCRIHSGDAVGGRTDLLIAAAKEPQRSVLRSYLGKAFANAGDAVLAERELGLALRLDPNDPTGWLYSSLLKQQQNRINEAIGDLEKSQTLNDNRSVYRSRLLLDQDRAVRSTSLAAIYRDDGMNEVSLREAATAVTYDYANFSTHLFLANSFDTFRDPTRFNLRYETPWFNELLLANLLAPVGVPTISQNISQQEYSRMFERDRLGLTTTTEVRGDGQYREIVSQFGAAGRFSYSMDLDWQHNDGVRPNNGLDRTEWYTQMKFQLTPQDSIFALVKYQDYHSGDNFQYFDPKQLTVVTNFPSTIVTNTTYRKHFSFDEMQTPIVVAAYHREWSPGVHTLVLGGRLVNDQHLNDRTVPLFVLNHDLSGNLASVSTSDFDIGYRSRLETWIGELNQIFKTDRNTLILGGRFQSGQFETKNGVTNTTIFNAFFPTVNSTITEDMQRWSVYAYDTWEASPSHLWLTAGLAYDEVDYPANFRQVPVTAGQASESLLCPKAAAVWRPCSMATIRSAYSRSLGGVSLDESYRLEPPQLAGFNQSYRTIISESAVGSVSAPKIESFGTALDLKLSPRTYVGLIGEILNSEVDRDLGVFSFPPLAPFSSPSSTRQQLRYNEYSATLVVNQLVSTEWALGAAYRFTRSELEQTLADVPLALFAGGRRTDSSDLHNLKLYLLYSHASGFFARAEADCYWQRNSAQTYTTGGSAMDSTLPRDEFCQLNFWLGYRFRKGLGDVSVGLLNATDTDYRLNPLNTYTELPRERIVAMRLRMRF